MMELNKAIHRTAHKAPPVTANVGEEKQWLRSNLNCSS
jgi:hypothetical protein